MELPVKLVAKGLELRRVALLHGFVALLHGFELSRAPAGRWGRVNGREGVCRCGADAAQRAQGGEALEQHAAREQHCARGQEHPCKG